MTLAPSCVSYWTCSSYLQPTKFINYGYIEMISGYLSSSSKSSQSFNNYGTLNITGSLTFSAYGSVNNYGTMSISAPE